jgi:hypothetical protein
MPLKGWEMICQIETYLDESGRDHDNCWRVFSLIKKFSYATQTLNIADGILYSTLRKTVCLMSFIFDVVY